MAAGKKTDSSHKDIDPHMQEMQHLITLGLAGGSFAGMLAVCSFANIDMARKIALALFSISLPTSITVFFLSHKSTEEIVPKNNLVANILGSAFAISFLSTVFGLAAMLFSVSVYISAISVISNLGIPMLILFMLSKLDSKE
ncbi:hypothetical protein [Sinorhizobium psoraleae]|uniref:hypothetical protein n=1 Tax=Sinorhizobium psoraleae TaxID=520838 RepID=UPI001568AFF7|nr:hypothetical protein [Sinorhizobium psoraleae]